MAVPRALRVDVDVDCLDCGDLDDLSLTYYWDWTGFPVVALPSGVGSRSGLPVSVSLVGAPGVEWDLLGWGVALQDEVGTVSPQ